MKSKKFFLPLLLAISFLLSITQVYAENALERIQKQGVLKVAIPADYPPYGFVAPDMSYKGYDVDMAQLIADKLKVKLELVPIAAPNRVPYLLTNKVDLTISSLGKSPDREKVIDFSISYAPFYQAIYGKKASPLANYDELSGRTISVTRGSMQDDKLREVAPKADIKRFEDNNATITAFLAGQTEFTATGSAVIEAVKQKNPAIDAELKIVIFQSACYVGVKKEEPELLAKVNDIIKTAKTDGVLDQWSMKWLGAPAGDLPE